jgi:dienelactone hydrolase
MKPRLSFCLVLLAATCAPTNSQTVVKPARLAEATMLRTPSGVEFAIVGAKGARPAPTLFVLGGAARDTVENETSNRIGWLLAKHGFLSVALDIPCHGKDQRLGEPPGLAGWRARLEKGEQLLTEFTRRLSSVIDFLVREGYADPARLGVTGPSRGGFIALHSAAAESRLRFAIAFAPVTDLLALREFQGIADPAPARALDVMRLLDKLVDRLIWVSIGHNDERVGTRHAIDFALQLMELSPLHKKPMTHFWSGDDIRLVVTPSEGASGHSSYRMAHDEAAAWVLRQLGE